MGLPGFATLPYTAGAWAGGYSRTPIVLNSASNAGLSCGTNSHCGSKPKAFTTRKVVKQIGGFNASSVVSYCKNPYTGCIETSGIQVHRDSGINDVAKLAASAGAIAAGTGSVLSGVGAIKYGNARENIAENGLTQRFEGMGDTNINVEGSSAHASGGEANAGASASAKAYQKTHNDIDIGISNSNHNGGGKGHGGPKGGGMPMTPKD